MLKGVNSRLVFAIFGWGNTVDNGGKVLVQTFKLITQSTVRPLNILQSIMLMRFLDAGYTQSNRSFTQLKMSIFNLLGGQFCSFSAGPINTTKLIKDL